MSNIAPTITVVPGPDGKGIDGYVVTWVLGNADTGLAVGSTIGYGASAIVAPGGSNPGISGCFSRSFAVTGTIGGATVVIEGSNDGTNFVPLLTQDPTGAKTAIATSFAAPTLPINVEVDTPVAQIRAHTSGGTGTTVTVTAFFRNPR